MMPEGAIANRRAALLAHALPARDRDWLLGELAPSHRSTLTALLEELRSMGIPRDPSLVRQLLDSDNRASPEHSLMALPAEDLPVLLRVLGREPPIVVARFLHVRNWPWRDIVLRQLDASARRVFEQGPDSVAAPRLQQALVASTWRAIERQTITRDLRPRNAFAWRRLFGGGSGQ